jgi:phage shock protein PspC (stress-responsive transcriptional regulator)
MFETLKNIVSFFGITALCGICFFLLVYLVILFFTPPKKRNYYDDRGH